VKLAPTYAVLLGAEWLRPTDAHPSARVTSRYGARQWDVRGDAVQALDDARQAPGAPAWPNAKIVTMIVTLTEEKP
jgi:hypothetical protein